MLADSGSDPVFSADPYVCATGTRSVLCMPSSPVPSSSACSIPRTDSRQTHFRPTGSRCSKSSSRTSPSPSRAHASTRNTVTRRPRRWRRSKPATSFATSALRAPADRLPECSKAVRGHLARSQTLRGHSPEDDSFLSSSAGWTCRRASEWRDKARISAPHTAAPRSGTNRAPSLVARQRPQQEPDPAIGDQGLLGDSVKGFPNVRTKRVRTL